MEKPTNLFDVYYLYEQHIQGIHEKNRAKNIINETRAAIVRPLLLGLGYQQAIGSGKMSSSETQTAFEFMKTQKLEKLLDARLAQQQGLKLMPRSRKSQKSYRNRLNQLLNWCAQQSWWPAKPVRAANFQDECCPTALINGAYRDRKKLINDRGKTVRYTLQSDKISSDLQAELEHFYQFMTSPEWPSRVTEPITSRTANNYLDSIRLMLGWFNQYQGIQPEQLSLGLLIKQLSKKELKDLSKKEKERAWKRYQQEFETWFCKYVKFLREIVRSESPRTKLARLMALSALGKFLYYTEVEDEADYADIPILKVIAKYSHSASEEVSEWERNKRYVANQAEKWPEPIEGQSVLVTVRDQVLLPLRHECRFKQKQGKVRTKKGLAISLQRYLAWSFLADMPARRQEESRSLKIALCCPINRPKEVPIDGLYHPLLPAHQREKRYDGSIADNYLYKTYVHKGKSYKDGVWVLDIQDYKTLKTHCAQSIKIPNRQFKDGTSLYDYIERYLYGLWMPLGHKNQQIYDWWQTELKGCRGRWVTAGRGEFEPRDVCVYNKNGSEFGSWGYFFVKPNTGCEFITTEYTSLIQYQANRLIGKCISPHTMRYIWATWAFQEDLTDQEKESLAYAMGHKVKTLKRLYERCTPVEKRRPIEKAIDKLLFNSLELEQSESRSTSKVNELSLKLEKLNSTERQRLLEMLSR